MSNKPGPHPPPPSNFHERKLATRRIPAGTIWLRFHDKNYGALHFGKRLAQRFDDPEQHFGVLYLARHMEGAFAELFSRNVEPYRFVTSEELYRKVLSEVTADRSLKLVDLAGIGLTRMGVDNRLATGSYGISQSWSRALQTHPQMPDGILYRSRHYPKHLCAAIFETRRAQLRAKQLDNLWDHLGEDGTYALLARYRLGIV